MGDVVVVWGEILWDRFPDGDRLGGAPANVAWHVAQTGDWATLISRVGDDSDGMGAIGQLEQIVDTSFVQIDPERATGEVTVRLENGEPRYTLHSGRAWERIECTEEARKMVQGADVFVYGTLAQRTPEGLASWREAVTATRGTCVCDLNLRPTDQSSSAVRAAIDHAHVVKLNDRELELLRALLGWDDPLATLRSRVRIVALTHGAAGSTLFGEAATVEIPSHPAAAGGDNVGCGDAYLAILVHGLVAGWDLARSGRAASRYAAAVAGERGAQPMFHQTRVADLLEIG